jgi:phosphatidyl-myo-inositol alpha-mannosyltransferase
MRIGIVCPYAWDVPGGVQAHVRDLTGALLRRGHDVSVMAPADDDAPLPNYVVSAGRAVPVPYNGSFARLTFGLVSNTRVRRWLREGEFDVLHVHEPASPSLSLLACWAAEGPIVATFHTSMQRSRAMSAAYTILQPVLEKISARITVSEDARRTLVEHLGGDAVLIPNGVAVRSFAGATSLPGWPGTGGALGFLGRIDEQRKGLDVLMDALPTVAARFPDVRLLLAGPGDVAEATKRLSPRLRDQVTFLGMVDETTKARALASVDVFVAPNIGGESFGIVLLEAMAAGTAVLASDLEAFRRVLDDGRAGAMFPAGDARALGECAVSLLGSPEQRSRLRAAAVDVVHRYDWDAIAGDVVAVYEMVSRDAPGVREDESTPAMAPNGWRARLGSRLNR